MAVTRAAINKNDNEIVLQWSRIASAEEARAVTVAEILGRLIEGHIGSNGDVPPKRTGKPSKETPDAV